MAGPAPVTPAKRALDLTLALVLAAGLALPFAALVLWLRLTQPGPVFHASERMMAPGRPFRLWKLRSMAPGAGDGGVTGGHKAALVTPAGRFLRRSRLDEVPQLWNVIRGEMSMVGPRPPLRTYVERFPALYACILRSRPGITGLATQVFHRHEERILARCTTPEETDAAYVRRCVPRKARLDLIYQHRRRLGLDLWILWRTAVRRQR